MADKKKKPLYKRILDKIKGFVLAVLSFIFSPKAKETIEAVKKGAEYYEKIEKAYESGEVNKVIDKGFKKIEDGIKNSL